MNKIRKGDQVIIRKGKDRGKRGTVLRVLADDKALVESLNLVKKHVKPNPSKNVTGGIVEREAPIALSNLALFEAGAGKGGRVGIKTLEDGRKVRFFWRSGEVLDA